MIPIEPDHYGVLELEPGSPMEEVKSQYRRLAKRYHPDLHNNDVRSQEKFRRVNAAYTFLLDAPRKAAYDAGLEAARKRAASAASSRKPPPPAASRASATATGYHARTAADVRMTRSAWLGATAGAVLVLLVIGLSLDGSGPSRPVGVEGASPATPESASGSALGDGLKPGVDADSSADSFSTSAPFAVPTAGASLPSPRVTPGVPHPSAPVHAGMMGRVPLFRVGSAWTPPRTEEATPAKALRQRLLTRYHTVLPRTDRLINQGYVVRAASPDTENGSRRILRDQLATDLADLSATRARVRPAVTRLPRQDTPKKRQQETGPILSDLRRLEDARQPVRDDIRALATVPAASRFAPPAPARAASVVASPSDSAPAVAPASPEAPKPPDKSAMKPAVKPKAPASSGQEFIMWGK